VRQRHVRDPRPCCRWRELTAEHPRDQLADRLLRRDRWGTGAVVPSGGLFRTSASSRHVWDRLDARITPFADAPTSSLVVPPAFLITYYGVSADILNCSIFLECAFSSRSHLHGGDTTNEPALTRSSWPVLFAAMRSTVDLMSRRAGVSASCRRVAGAPGPRPRVLVRYACCASAASSAASVTARRAAAVFCACACSFSSAWVTPSICSAAYTRCTASIGWLGQCNRTGRCMGWPDDSTSILRQFI